MSALSSDPFNFDDLFTPEQRALRDQVRDYMETAVKPAINNYWERAEIALDLALGLKELPIIGGTLQGHGCAGLDSVSDGLVKYEVCRVDGSISTIFGVHSGLAMGSIGLLGSEEQQERWLPAMARMERLGAFALTEPERGSDAAHVLTTARQVGEHFVLNGRKRWIGNGTIADLIIVWARDEGRRFGGFVLEDPAQLPGFTANAMTGKISKRAVHQAEITLDEVHVPAANRLANCNSFRDLARVLALGRAGVAWEAVGLAAGCYEIALDYACRREQFGKPIASFQLVQAKLVEMAADLAQAQLMVWRLAKMMEAGTETEGQLSLAKQSCAAKARRAAALAREILGANGILLDHHAARLFTDVEATYAYEGTNEINLLIAGRELTGIGAFV
ncbi:MAG: acyl-CoA dehydrogenase family protein [Caldilineaceae bacterium]|nr:acyl-CoA dehydrogenase family protein [Caldilineaceae bacterium]